MQFYRALSYIFFASSLFAQQTSTLHGVVTDSSGAVIAAVPVTVTAGAAKRSGQTQNDGNYTFSGLAAGEYQVSATFPGFTPFVQSITLAAGASSQLPIRLTPMAAKQEVTVTAERGAEVSVDPGQNASAVVLREADLDVLPDDPEDLTTALAALAGPSAGPNGSAMVIDGFTGGSLPPKNTIKEIRINQNPFSAEYDYLGFGRVEIITKPGTDTLRGNFQLTDSDAFFNSRNPYAANKADYVNRTFNETLSSSFHHKGSWTLNLTQNKIDNNAIIHAVMLDPATLTPLPVEQSVITPRTNLGGTGRLDYQLTTNHAVTARYSYNRNDRQNSGIGNYSLLSRAYSGEGDSKELQLTETAVINSNLATETRFALARSGNLQYGDTATPAINVSGSFNAGGNQVGNTLNRYGRVDIQNVSTLVHGTHTMRFGGRWWRQSVRDNTPSNFGGTFTFFGVANAPVLDSNNQPVPGSSMAIGSLEQYRRTLFFQNKGYSIAQIQALGGGASQFTLAGGNPLAEVAQGNAGVYFQDDWRVKPNVLLSLGFRFETQTGFAHPQGYGPRLGLAWSPGSTASKPGKTVIRLGAGLFGDRFGTSPSLQAAHYDGVSLQQYLITSPQFFGTIPTLASLAAQKQPSVRWQLDKNMKPCIELMEAVTLEQQLRHSSNISVTFLHIDGKHVPIIANVNSPLPGTYDPANPASGVRPYGNSAGNIFEYKSTGIFNQKMVFAKWEMKVSKQASFIVNYSLRYANHDADWMGTPSDAYNPMADYGRASYDRRHSLTITGNFDLPLKFTFSPFLILNSGAPFDLTVGRDLNGDSFASDRPAFATDMSRASVVKTKFGAFDTNPVAGQIIVPHYYLDSPGMWNLNARFGRTFNLHFGQAKPAALAAGATPAPAPENRYKLNFNAEVNNVFNHLNPGGFVGNLSSPLFGQATSINLFRDTSNLRRVQFGTTFSF